MIFKSNSTKSLHQIISTKTVSLESSPGWRLTCYNLIWDEKNSFSADEQGLRNTSAKNKIKGFLSIYQLKAVGV